jgi:hypothetical protein
MPGFAPITDMTVKSLGFNPKAPIRRPTSSSTTVWARLKWYPTAPSTACKLISAAACGPSSGDSRRGVRRRVRDVLFMGYLLLSPDPRIIAATVPRA